MEHLRQALMSFKAATLSSLFPLEEEKGVSRNEHSPEGDGRAIY